MWSCSGRNDVEARSPHLARARWEYVTVLFLDCESLAEVSILGQSEKEDAFIRSAVIFGFVLVVLVGLWFVPSVLYPRSLFYPYDETIDIAPTGKTYVERLIVVARASLE